MVGRLMDRDSIYGIEGREAQGQRFHLKDEGHEGSWLKIPFKGLGVGRVMARDSI